MSEFKERGKFWFPSFSNRTVNGSVTFDASADSIVSLEEILDDTLERPSLHYDIILGRLEDGTSITLVDCDEMGFEMKPRHRHKFEVGIIIRGEHFQKPTEIAFEGMKVHITHLPEWLGLWNKFMFGLTSKFETTKFKYKDFTVTLDTDPRITGLIQSIGYNTTKIKMINEGTYVRLQSASRKHYSEFIEIINGLKELLMFATGANISAFSLQGTIIYDDKKSEVRLLDIYYKDKDFSSDRVFSPITMLFTYDDVSNRFQSFVEKWAGRHAILRDVYELYFLSILPPTISSRQRFKNLVNGLECFHRLAFPEQNPEYPEDVHKERMQRIRSSVSSQDWDWLTRKLEISNEISLRNRIRILMEDDIIKKLVKDEEKNTLLQKFVENRHKFTHRCKFIATDEELDRLNSIARMILEVKILRYLDFSSESIEYIIMKNLRYVRGGAARMLKGSIH